MMGPGGAVAQDAKVTMDFTNVEIKDLVKTMSKLTGQNFLVDPGSVRGTVTLISPTPVSVRDAYRIFLSVLESKNLGLRKVGQLYKIVGRKDAKESGVPIISLAKRRTKTATR